MIDVIFLFGGEHIFVRVQDCNIFFRTQQSMVYATIDGLKLDKQGVIKEHPDLADKENWKEEAIKRFKDKMKELKTEKERAMWIIKDLGGHNYIPKYLQMQGSRAIKL